MLFVSSRNPETLKVVSITSAIFLNQGTSFYIPDIPLSLSLVSKVYFSSKNLEVSKERLKSDSKHSRYVIKLQSKLRCIVGVYE